MSITIYMTCNPFICTILVGLSESSRITLLKDFILEIIKFNVTEKAKKKKLFSANLALNIFSSRSLNKVILKDSNIHYIPYIVL